MCRRRRREAEAAEAAGCSKKNKTPHGNVGQTTIQNTTRENTVKSDVKSPFKNNLQQLNHYQITMTENKNNINHQKSP